jgi:hypothetical protein
VGPPHPHRIHHLPPPLVHTSPSRSSSVLLALMPQLESGGVVIDISPHPSMRGGAGRAKGSGARAWENGSGGGEKREVVTDVIESSPS